VEGKDRGGGENGEHIKARRERPGKGDVQKMRGREKCVVD